MALMTLEEAQSIKSDASIEDVLAIEVAIRELTNNRFYREINGKPTVRFYNVVIKDDGRIGLSSSDALFGIRIGDRIELGGTRYNPELLTVKELNTEDNTITVKEKEELLKEDTRGMFITLVDYPADVKQGAKELLSYKEKMKGITGLKSVSMARVKQTYYDVNADDTVDGVPASVFSFIDKYYRLSWGV